jgi:hypothetical protein
MKSMFIGFFGSPTVVQYPISIICVLAQSTIDRWRSSGAWRFRPPPIVAHWANVPEGAGSFAIELCDFLLLAIAPNLNSNWGGSFISETKEQQQTNRGLQIAFVKDEYKSKQAQKKRNATWSVRRNEIASVA